LVTRLVATLLNNALAGQSSQNRHNDGTVGGLNKSSINVIEPAEKQHFSHPLSGIALSDTSWLQFPPFRYIFNNCAKCKAEEPVRR
jgi:hypothetical protein